MKAIEPRLKLTQPDLIALLNWELAAYEECEGCHVSGVELRRVASAAECNWGRAVIEDAGEPDPGKQRIIEEVLAETRARFDVWLPS